MIKVFLVWYEFLVRLLNLGGTYGDNRGDTNREKCIKGFCG